MITALCNVFIHSKSKLELFKETFSRVYGISDNWLINIRGKYRGDVLKYIQETFDNVERNCIFFSGLNENDWAKSTRKMFENSKYEYVYVFLEDHFLLKSLDHFRDVIQDMMDSKIDCFTYSFFNVGLSVGSAEGLYPDYSKHFFFFQFDGKNSSFLKKNSNHFYPYSLAGICTKRYFQKLLEIERKILVKVPFLLQVFMENCFFMYPRNRAFWFFLNKIVSSLGIRFVIYSPATPFNLEKSLFDCDSELLPFVVGGLKEELFANWDDDNRLSNSSLIKRGLYPKYFRVGRSAAPKSTEGKEYILAKGHSSKYQYCPDVARIKKLPMKHIYISKGSLMLISEKETFHLNDGQSAWVAANIPHTVFALEECVFRVYIESGL